MYINIQQISLRAKFKNILAYILSFSFLLIIQFCCVYDLTNKFQQISVGVIKDKNEVLINQKQFIFGEKTTKLNLSDIDNAQIILDTCHKGICEYNIVFKLNYGNKYKIYCSGGPSLGFMTFVVNNFNEMRDDKKLPSYKISSNFKIKDLLIFKNLKNLSYATKYEIIAFFIILFITLHLILTTSFMSKITIDIENQEIYIKHYNFLRQKRKIKFQDIENIQQFGCGQTQILYRNRKSLIITETQYISHDKRIELINSLKSLINTDK